jgi:hypothetical protein
MLHLRLIAPPDSTGDAVRLIENTVGTTHLVVLTGAARDPEGDVVTCDVAREAGDRLLSGLQELGRSRAPWSASPSRSPRSRPPPTRPWP